MDSPADATESPVHVAGLFGGSSAVPSPYATAHSRSSPTNPYDPSARARYATDEEEEEGVATPEAIEVAPLNESYTSSAPNNWSSAVVSGHDGTRDNRALDPTRASTAPSRIRPLSPAALQTPPGKRRAHQHVETPKEQLASLLREVPSVASQLSSAVNSPARPIGVAPLPTRLHEPSTQGSVNSLRYRGSVKSSQRSTTQTVTTYFQRGDRAENRTTNNTIGRNLPSPSTTARGRETLVAEIRDARVGASTPRPRRHNQEGARTADDGEYDYDNEGERAVVDEVSLSEQDAAKIFHLLQQKDAHIADLTQSLASLQDQLSQARASASTSGLAQEELVRQCQKSRTMSAKFEEMYNEERAANVELRAHVKVQLEEAVRIKRDFGAAMEDAMDAKTALSQDVQNLREEVEKHVATESKLRRRLNGVTQEKDSLQQELQNMCDDLKLLIRNAVESTQSNEHIVAALNTQLRVAETELKQMTPIVEQRRIDQEKIERLEGSLREEERRNVHLEAELRAIQRRDAQRVADAETSRELSDALQSQLDSLEARLVASHNAIADQVRERQRLEDDLDFAEVKRKTAERQVATLEEKLDVESATNTDLRISLEEVARDNAALIDDCEAETDRCYALEARMEELQAEVQSLSEMLDLRRQHTSALHEQSSAVEERVDLLEDTLLKTKAELSAAVRAADALKDNCRELEGRLQTEQETRLSETVLQRQEFADISSKQGALILAAATENQMLSKDLAESRGSLQARLAEVESLTEQLTACRAAHATTTTEAAKVRQQYAAIRAEASKKEEYIAVLETKLEEMNQQLEQQRVSNARVEQELERQRGLVKSQKERVVAVQSALSDRDRDQGTLEGERARRTQLEGRLKSVEVQLSSKSESLKRLLDERSEQLLTISRLESDLASIKETADVSKVREVSKLTAALQKSEKQLEDVSDCLIAQQDRVKTLFGAQLRAAMGDVANDLVTALRYLRLTGKHNRLSLQQMSATAEETLKVYERQCKDATASVRRDYEKLATKERELREASAVLVEAYQSMHDETERFKREVAKEVFRSGGNKSVARGLAEDSTLAGGLPLASRPRPLAERHANISSSVLIASGHCAKKTKKPAVAPSLNVSSVRAGSSYYAPSATSSMPGATATEIVHSSPPSDVSSLNTSDEADMLWTELQKKMSRAEGPAGSSDQQVDRSALSFGGGEKLRGYLDDISKSLGCQGGFDDLIDKSVHYEVAEAKRLNRLRALLGDTGTNPTQNTTQPARDVKDVCSIVGSMVLQRNEEAAQETTAVMAPSVASPPRVNATQHPHNLASRSGSADSGLVEDRSSTLSSRSSSSSSSSAEPAATPAATNRTTPKGRRSKSASRMMVTTVPGFLTNPEEELKHENNEAARLRTIKLHIQELLLRQVRHHIFCDPTTSKSPNPTSPPSLTPAELRVTNLFNAQKRTFTSLETLLWDALPSSSSAPNTASLPKHLSRLKLKDVFTYCIDAYCKI